MKYFIGGLLLIVLILTACRFTVNQKLADAADAYKAAEKKLNTLYREAHVQTYSIESWSKELNKGDVGFFAPSDSSKAFYQKNIDEEKELLQVVNSQIVETQALVKKLEPLKKKYDKQVKKERDRRELRDSILYGLGTVGLPLAFSIWFVGFIFRTNRKHRQMLVEGKITQEEYDKLMKPMPRSMFTRESNPATGISMVGSLDAAGNARGCSHTRSFDHTQGRYR